MVISSRIRKYIKDMFFSVKPGLFNPDGGEHSRMEGMSILNTFYQEVTYRTVDAQDSMQAQGSQATESVMLAEVLNTQTKKKERNRRDIWASADGNAEVTRFVG